MLAQILIVLPDSAFRKALAQRLEYRGYLVHRAQTEGEAAQVLERTRVNLIVTSASRAAEIEPLSVRARVSLVRLPEQDALEAAAEAKRGEEPQPAIEALVARIEAAFLRPR